MSRIFRNTSGGKAVSGGALAPRSRRNNTLQVDSYFRGGSAAVVLPEFVGGNLSGASLLDIFNTYSYGTAVSPTSGGTLTVNSLSLGSYDYAIKSSSTTVSAFSNADFFTATADSRSAFVMINGDLTINSGQTFIPSNRKLFTAIYVTGDLTVNGSISMTARGASHSATTEQAIKLTASTTIPASGSGSTGNGGAGGGTRGATGGSGATGTVFSGGPGGGGMCIAGTGQAGGARGDKGGDGQTYNQSNGGSPGAGNPGGGRADGNSNIGTAGDGTGGTIFIFVKGTISGSGSITSAGSSGATCSFPDGSSGGGGSGGGHITICRLSGTSPTLSAGGGGGGSASGGGQGAASGSSGGTGTTQTVGLT